VRDPERFRQAVRERCRTAGHTQQQLARAIGLHPNVLSHKVHQRGAGLTAVDVIAIVTTLAGWGAVSSQAEARTLLALMAVPPHAVPARAWAAPPLSDLPPGPAPGEQHPDERGAEPDGHADGSRLLLAPAPVPVTPLVGREAEVAAVVSAVTGNRLVTLTGTGGTGKTRIALAAAAELTGRFADGVAFADLAPLGDADLVDVTLLRALGLLPGSAAAAEEQLAAALAPAHLLLVADNLEHLVERAPLLGRLLAAAPRLHLLVTSRIALGLYGEHQVRVPPLRLPETTHADAGGAAGAEASEAVRLFIQRARAVDPGFAPHGEALTATAAVCAALDGLPLAIELAAARVRLYPPQALLARLRDRLSLLTGGARNLPQRQQTIRAALDWSDALLPGPARELFACLGVFAGPFDAAAASAVRGAPDAAEMVDRLAELAGHSLLEVTPGQVPRFTMLATVREYAQARLAESGQTDLMHDRHLRYYLALATEARASLDGPDQGAWLDRLEADFADIRAAMDWARLRGPADAARLEDGLRLASAVGPMWRRRGSLAEGALHLERLLALDTRLAEDTGEHAAAPATRAWAVLEACAMACFRGDYPASKALAEEGLALCGPLGDLAGLAWAHRYLGEAALAAGDLATAGPHFGRQLAYAQQAGDLWTEASARNMLGQVARYQGRYAGADAELTQALRGFRAAGDPGGAASALNSLGEVARDRGQAAEALALFRQALRGHWRIGSRRGMAADLEGLATAAALDGAPRTALVYLGAAQALHQASGGLTLPVEQDLMDRLLDANLDSLSPRDRDQALAEGRTRPLDQLVAEVLGD
jgi:predicted ATPase